VEPVQKLVASYIEGMKPLSNVGTEFSLKLPSSETPKFADMLDELERHQTALGITSYGISATTLEEVFLRVARGKGHSTSSAGESAESTRAAAPAGSSAPTPVFLRGGERASPSLSAAPAGSSAPAPVFLRGGERASPSLSAAPAGSSAPTPVFLRGGERASPSPSLSAAPAGSSAPTPVFLRGGERASPSPSLSAAPAGSSAPAPVFLRGGEAVSRIDGMANLEHLFGATSASKALLANR
jgi:hypothetical protein